MSAKKGRHLIEQPARTERAKKTPIVKKTEGTEPKSKTPKKRSGLIGLAAVLVVIAVIAAAGALFVSSKLDKISYAQKEPSETPTIHRTDETPAPTIVPEEGLDVIGSSEAPEGDVFSDKNIVNILLLGSDAGAAGPNDPGRADCIMLCSLNKKTGDVKLISFERGITVSFDVYPYSDILTHTYVWGGPELTLDIIRKYFLLDVLGYVHVNYDAFITGIDAIGGVDIELTEREAGGLNEDLYTNAVTKNKVHEGMNHLDGYDALQYCRLRFIDSDWHRIERQRNMVQAALTKAKSLSLKELNEVADTMLPLINTNLSKSDIVSLLFYAPKFIGSTAGQMTVPDHIPGDPVVWCHFDRETQKIKDFIYGEDGE